MMMDSPPELSPPPELKSSLDPSGLVVHEPTGKNRADVAKKIGFLGLEPAAEGNRESGEQAGLAEHCCIMHVCLGSLRASRERLNGQNPAEESGLCRQLYRLEPSIVPFKKE